MRSKLTTAARLLLALVTVAAERTAHAQHVPLPPVNLGGTSFVDGVAGPGTLLELITTGRHAPSSVTSGAALAHVAVLFPPKFLGGYWGTEVLVPFAHVAVRGEDRTMTGTGFGDIGISPLIVQWPAVKSASGRPLFFQRVSLTVTLPTGAYARDADVNIGNNILGVNPYYAFTFFFTDELETSFRLHYLYNSANDAPPDRFQAESIQPGQAVHVNGAISYAILPELRVGVGGYYLKQITDGRIDGGRIDSREQVAAVGPGFRVAIGMFALRVNAFHEFAAEHRPEGMTLAITVSDVLPWPSDPSH